MRFPDYSKLFMLLIVIVGITVSAPAQAKTFENWVPKSGDVIDFKVLRNGKPFGHHRVSFEVDGTTTIVKNDIELKVSLGPVPLFYYGHESTETWSGDELTSLKGETRKDGKTLTVNVSREDEQLKAVSQDGGAPLPAEIIPSSHWNIQEVQSTEILSSENGDILPVEIEKLGSETIKTANGEITADKYRLKSDLSVDLWYDESGQWVKARFEARGQTIDYVLQ